MSEWPCQGGEEGGGAGVPPNHRTPHTVPDNHNTAQKLLRPAVFSKLENLVREMQDAQHGVPVRSQKLFLTSIPAAFMGYDLIEWLMDRLCIEDSLEAVHLANLLCQFGYYFPVNEQKNLLVKDDSSLYRFQSPYYWPSQHHTPDNIEYAIYLYKRAQRRRNIHGLEPGLPDYEMDALNNLKKILSGKWDFVTMQGEEQLKVAKDRKKGDKIINDSQEKAYWRVYRPPPGYSTLVENSPVPTREQRVKARRNNKELLREELEFLRSYLNISRVRTSQVAESLLDYTDTFVDYDPILVGVGPSNPWMTDDLSFWEINKPIPEVATKKRLERWAISLEDTVTDPLGVQELLAFMKKEYCHENMRFWMSVQELKRGPGTESKIKKKVREIWEEFLSKGAGAEINIDSKTMEETKIAMKTPNRHTFDRAADHVYTLLLKKDCYPRFLRSEHYKCLLANSLNPGSSRKRFFNFPVRKKPSQNQPPNPGQPPGLPHPAREPRDFSIYGMEVKTDQECQEQSLTSSREFDEACPWEAEPPDVSRNRKVSNAGVLSSELPASQPPNSFKQRPTSETSVNENAKPGRGPPHHIPLSNRKSFSEETSHVIKSTAAIGRLVYKREEEDKSAMEIDFGEDAVISRASKNRTSVSGEGEQGKLSDASVFSLPPDSPKSQVLPSKVEEDVSGSSTLPDASTTPATLPSSHQPAPPATLPPHPQDDPPPPRLSEVAARPTTDSIQPAHNTRSRKKSSESSFPDLVTSKDILVGGDVLLASRPDVQGAYSGAGGGVEAMEDGEEDCWIAAEDICPWEDDSLTPTWL